MSSDWFSVDCKRPRRRAWRTKDGRYSITPTYARGRGNRLLKKTVFVLREGGRAIGCPFASARLAKAFCEAYAALGDDRRARAAFIRNGGGWCYDKEREWRRARDERRFASYRNTSDVLDSEHDEIT